MNQRIWSVVLAITMVSTLTGCGIGYNRMLFATKTNVGFEVDTKPPVIQLDINRLEGVYAPQFERGKKLPVMASFKFANEESFSPYLGSAFATGDAAVALAALYADRTPAKDWRGRLEMVRKENPDFDSGLQLNKKPHVDDGLTKAFAERSANGDYFQSDDVRPVFFGTDTSMGLKITWSGVTGAFPDSARLGYGRKELAWVPITMTEKGAGANKKYEMKTSSLLATVDAGVTQPQLEEGAPKIKLDYVQYFATGDAATLLSLQQEVRRAMLVRLDPNQGALSRRFSGLGQAGRAVGISLLRPLYGVLVKQAKEKKTDPVTQQERDVHPRAAGFLKRMDELVPAGFEIDFVTYSFSKSTKVLNETQEVFNNAEPPSFHRLVDYDTKLDDSIEELKRAIVSGDESKRGDYIERLTELTTKQARFRIDYFRNDVIADVIDYFIN